MRVVVTPISVEPAVAAVERAAGVRPERAVWEFGHWLLGAPASGRRPRISTECRRWVVVPGAGCQEVAAMAIGDRWRSLRLGAERASRSVLAPGRSRDGGVWCGV